MKYNLKVSLNLSQSERKFSDRIYEIKTAAPYLKYCLNPEIDLFRITLNDKDELRQFLNIIEKNLKNISYLPFKTRGWRKHKKGDCYGLSFSIETSDIARELLSSIKKDLELIGISNEITCCNPENNFDILIAESKNFGNIGFLWENLQDKTSLFSKILLRTIYVRSKRPLHNPRKFCYSFDVLNVTIDRDNKKYHEYSLPCGEWVRPEDKSAWKKTYEKYRIVKNYQLSQKHYFPNKISPEKIFVSSDLHLDHREIINVTARPFRKNDLELMNETLISNWNLTVNHKDTVIFAGDLTYNANFSTSQKYLEILNGKKIFVRGNHDKINCKSFLEYEINYKNINFLVVHNPKNAPKNYDGWIIHGHTHNSRMCDYPFINFINRTINVSCELTGYHPIELNEIVRILEHYRKRGVDSIYSIDSIRHLESELNNSN